MLDYLEEQGGKDPLQDRFYNGYMAAVRDVQNINIEEVTLGD
jgi:hypothetical protein